MIYFDEKTTEQVVNKLGQALKPGGYFLIGQSESLININHEFTPIKSIPSIYRK